MNQEQFISTMQDYARHTMKKRHEVFPRMFWADDKSDHVTAIKMDEKREYTKEYVEGQINALHKLHPFVGLVSGAWHVFTENKVSKKCEIVSLVFTGWDEATIRVPLRLFTPMLRTGKSNSLGKWQVDN